MVKMLKLRSRRCGLDSWQGHYHVVTTYAVCLDKPP